MLRLSRLQLCWPGVWNEISLTKAIHLPKSVFLRRNIHEVHNKPPVIQDDLESVVSTEPSQSKRHRRLRDQDFVDHIIIKVEGGKGGNGCVAFHRPSSPLSPRQSHRLGPPSGGNGGRGGNIYFLPDESLTSLASVPRKVKGKPGTHGSGEWRNGRKGMDKVVRVPNGTVVRVVGWGDCPEGGNVTQTDMDEETKRQMRKKNWVHYPGWEEANLERNEFREAEKWMEKEERGRMREGMVQWGDCIREGRVIDLDAEITDEQGYLFASGGSGGLGNPHFSTNITSTSTSPSPTGFARAPKFATRGLRGDILTLSLELKTPADVALVGRCNVGKSTLIRALTGGRVKSDVGAWEGVTRDVVRGVVRIAQGDGGEGAGQQSVWEGELGSVTVFDEGMKIAAKERRVEADDEGLSPVPTKPGHAFDLYESFRFTITDNPGFVLPSTRMINEDLEPITKTILRSIERARALVYVVDLSGDSPWDELKDVMKEVGRGDDRTRRGLVVANKADLLVASEEGEVEVAKAREKLKKLEEYVKHEIPGDTLEVVPVSAKWGMNLRKVVRSLERLLFKQ